MKILYDLCSTQSFGSSKFHGGGEYAKTVFYEIIGNTIDAQNISVIYFDKYSLDDKILKILDSYKINKILINEINEIQHYLNDFHFDIFYSALPYYLNSIKIPEKTTFVFTIHGLRTIEMPRDNYEIKYANNFKEKLIFLYKTIFKRQYFKKRYKEFMNLMKISKNIKLIVPSQHTKYSLKQKFSDLDIKSISVLYSPKNYLIMDKNSLSFDLVNTKALPKKYFLLISGDRWIKNGIRMIKAIDNLYSNNNINDYKTIVLGVKDERIFNFVKNKKSFEFKSYVSYEDLERYYFNSFAFLYPSLNEGFGYPPLDAMKYKIPVITSAISSVTEICDNGVLYFNPFDISEMENRILQITYDHNIYKDISEKGYKRFLDVSLKQQEDLKKAVNLILKKDVPY